MVPKIRNSEENERCNVSKMPDAWNLVPMSTTHYLCTETVSVPKSTIKCSKYAQKCSVMPENAQNNPCQ
jgi:hypothetical protein